MLSIQGAKNLKKVSLALMCGGIISCSHPLEIVGGGDLLSLSGTRDCTMEQGVCSNIVTGEYNEVFTAKPRPGYIFSRFEGCSLILDEDKSDKSFLEVIPNGNKCAIKASKNLVSDYYGKTVPSLIAHFTLATAIETSVLATWNANSESNLAGYILSYGTSPGDYSENIELNNLVAKNGIVEYEISDLEPGNTYYFAVRAVNDAGYISSFSNEASKTYANN
jgi:hypothetical protein